MNNTAKRGWLWLAMITTTLIAVTVIAIPTFTIMPFKAQSATGVEWSYHLRRWSPLVTVLAALMFIALALKLWRGARWYGRAAMFVLFVPLAAVTWFARQNHFEWMFNPLPNAAYAAISETKFVADNEMVMTVALNDEVAAYPVRQMAYHHVVNDVVGGKPITATY
ncbi:MAG: DUF3179 domain-containing protein [Acidobacteria bacterium]|nr:DUF3179 domain-containing protein [Acidobacteriota bacterium]